MNIVEQLQADLSIYRRRQQKRGDVESVEQEIETVEDELIQVKIEQGKLQTLKTQVTDQKDGSDHFSLSG